MNFSEVKAIILPEGSVKRLTTSGVVLWEKTSSSSDTVYFYYYGNGPYSAPAGMTWEEYIGSMYDEIGELSIDERTGRVYNLDGDLEYWEDYENIGNGDCYVDANEPIVDGVDVGNMW